MVLHIQFAFLFIYVDMSSWYFWLDSYAIPFFLHFLCIFGMDYLKMYLENEGGWTVLKKQMILSFCPTFPLPWFTQYASYINILSDGLMRLYAGQAHPNYNLSHYFLNLWLNHVILLRQLKMILSTGKQSLQRWLLAG